MPSSLNDLGGNDDDGGGGDSDLEAELAAITAGGGGAARPRPKPKPTVAAAHDLDRMVAESLKDIDDDSDVDENDPDLLSELSEITETEAPPPSAPPPSSSTAAADVSADMPELLRTRLEMYRVAEANAKAAGDSSKARRIGRGIKTLDGLLRQAKAGRPVNVDDIPPEVTVKPSNTPSAAAPAEQPPPAVPTRSAPPAPPPKPAVTEATTPTVDATVMATLLARQREYKLAALAAKKADNKAKALELVKICKMFDVVIQSAQEGQPVDLSDMPPPPDELSAVVASTAPIVQPAKEEAEAQNRSEEPAAAAADEVPPMVTATTILGALQQRLDKYRSVEQAAKDENNDSKARRFVFGRFFHFPIHLTLFPLRRFGRIVKQYEDAVKRHKAGKPVPFEDLPTPPGFGPIPGVAPVITHFLFSNFFPPS